MFWLSRHFRLVDFDLCNNCVLSAAAVADVRALISNLWSTFSAPSAAFLCALCVLRFSTPVNVIAPSWEKSPSRSRLLRTLPLQTSPRPDRRGRLSLRGHGRRMPRLHRSKSFTRNVLRINYLRSKIFGPLARKLMLPRDRAGGAQGARGGSVQ